MTGGRRSATGALQICAASVRRKPAGREPHLFAPRERRRKTWRGRSLIMAE
jgi:hypothetical protein